ncbi:MAG: HlyD family efflux transporter periplasmic adaptor subunit, partial [Lachnospiraceae bacterium]|nr:HlyD family efflux transporter periplasmic adaptor subunit [Lachnospiraceae bacterium]
MKQLKKKEQNKKPLSRKKKRLIMIIAAGSLLVLAAGYTVFIAPLLEKEQWIYKEEVVERGTLKVGVSESGSLEYGITSIIYDLDLDVSTDDEDDEEEDEEDVVQKYLKIEEVYVKSGQRISEGDLLYKFTEDSVSDVRMLLQSAAVEAQSEYAQAQAEYNLSALEAKAEYESQKLAGEYASSIYQNEKESVENEITAIQVEINQRTANISSLQEQLDEATENYNEIWAEFKDVEKPSIENDSNTVNFMIMQKSYLNLQTQYENAKSALSRAQQSLEENAAEIESLKKEMSVLAAKKTVSKLDAEATYQKNKISGENAQITYDAQMESLKETLKEAAEEKDKITEQLEAFEVFVGEDGCLYADGTGIVTQVSYEAGDRLRNTGNMVSYATPADMTISVDVTQEDIVDLKVGDKVDITFTAYEDTSYEGSIQSINTTATSTESNTVSYTVVIAVEGDTSQLYGGMTAD